MLPGNEERQVAPSVDGIRRDHVARYEWALKHLEPNSRVLDLACGVGYGCDILAKAGHEVIGVDRDPLAIEYATKHYSGHGARFTCQDANAVNLEDNEFDAVVCFETVEHIKTPAPLLRQFRKGASKLIVSVPNETVFPYRNYKFHYRHYTKNEFNGLLHSTGWHPVKWFGQKGAESDVEADMEGRTLIAICEPGEKVEQAPEHVAIIGLGPSIALFSELTRRMGGNHAFCDEVWGINQVGDVLACDRVFHMDDLRVQEARAKANPEGAVAKMVEWLKTARGPIYTSIVRPEYPGLVAFPLEEFLNAGYHGDASPYFNSTAAYAVAYAIHIGVKRISLFGVDYTLPNRHHAEKGRACVEFWLGVAAARGIQISVPPMTTLLDSCEDEKTRLYGYDCVDVSIEDAPDGSVSLTFTDVEPPTADEIEKRYDHSKHPNSLVEKEMSSGGKD